MSVVCNLTAYEVGNSMDIPNNSTKVYVKLTATTSGASYNNNSPSGSITIDGSVHLYSKNIPKSSTITLYEGVHTILHDSDGKKSIGISYSFATGISAGTLTGSKTLELTTVPRTSSVTCADGNIGSATTININRATSSFTHTLKYAFGTLSGTIASKTSNTSIGWTIPTSFYAQIPNAKSGQGTITCETYSGNTLIGTTTCKFNAIVLEEDNKPTISGTIVDVNETTKALTGDENKLIKYFSNAKVTMTATPKNSATIKSQKITCADGKSSTSATATLNKVESGTFNLSCTDSRNFTTTTKITKTMVNYIKLAITSLTVTRVNSTSNTIKISLKGNYFNSSFGTVSNTLTLKWRYRLKGKTWSGYTTVTATKIGNTFSYNGTLGTNFDYQEAYEFEIVAQDKLITDTKSKEVTEGIPLFDIWKNNLKINGIFSVLENIRKYNGSNYIDLLAEELTSNYTQYLPNENGTIQLKPTVLYDNDSGTTGTVTLSETSANFSYLKIFYGICNSSGTWTQYSSREIANPNGKSVVTDFVRPTNAEIVQLASRGYSISGTNITLNETEKWAGINSNGVVASQWQDGSSLIKIVKVIGYK